MKILVTGATGFIGSHVIEFLLDRGHQVIATSTNQEKAIKKSWYKDVTYRQHDIREIGDNLFSFFNEPEALIHLSWQGLPNYKELFHLEENLFQHYAFIKNLVVNGLKNVTVTGTCFEYGMKEGCLEENMVSDPANSYAIAKDTLRKFLQELNKKQSFSYKWVRLFYMYGAGQSSKSILPLLHEALDSGAKSFNMSKGDQLRDYLPIETVAENICKIATQSRIEGIVNCCSGHPVALKDFVSDYLKKIGRAINLNLGYYPYSDLEPFAFWGDTTKLKTITSK